MIRAAFLAALLLLAATPADATAPRPAPDPTALLHPVEVPGADGPDRTRTGAPQQPSGPVESHPADRKVPLGGAPSPRPSPELVVGIASTYGPGWDGWIAWPAGAGYRLRVCGRFCAVVISNDAGPDLAMQRRGRVIDLDVPTFERVCDVPWTRGLCRVSVEQLQ